MHDVRFEDPKTYLQRQKSTPQHTKKTQQKQTRFWVTPDVRRPSERQGVWSSVSVELLGKEKNWMTWAWYPLLLYMPFLSFSEGFFLLFSSVSMFMRLSRGVATVVCYVFNILIAGLVVGKPPQNLAIMSW